MNLLTGDQAFSAGARVWIMPPLRVSAWTREVDWYLGFQIKRSESFSPKPLPVPLDRLLLDNPNMRVPREELPDTAPLHIVAEGRLPTDAVVVLEATSPRAWTEQVQKLWVAGQNPALRLFLPPDVSRGDLGPLSRIEELEVVMPK